MPGRPKTKKLHRGAFTLIEMLIVMLIITILTGLVVTGLKRGISAKNRTLCKANLKALQKALVIRMSDNPNNPTLPVALTDATFLRDFVGLTLKMVRCPLAPDGQLGYEINNNVLAGSALINGEDTAYANIFIYEVVSNLDDSISYRHNNNTQAITLYGDLLYTDDLTQEMTYIPPT
jgi:prepilin-type N-terminal cleavage/methylation domain-containing protein